MSHNSKDSQILGKASVGSVLEGSAGVGTEGESPATVLADGDSKTRLLPAIRSIIYTPIYLLVFLLLMIVFLIFTMIPGTKFLQDETIRLWAWFSLYPFGVRCHVEGVENVPKKHGFLYLFNHQSHFDIPACYHVLPRSFRFGAKIELYKIPIFGAVLRRAGSLPIARQNRAEVFKVYEGAKARAAQGEVFILAPEGTRQENPEIGPFKKGPFLLAVGAEMPLVPVVLYGVHEVLAKGRLLICAHRRRQHIWLKVLPSIETKGLNADDLDGLVQKVRDQMVEAYAELAQKSLAAEKSRS